jgi:hypothetical protein
VGQKLKGSKRVGPDGEAGDGCVRRRGVVVEDYGKILE